MSIKSHEYSEARPDPVEKRLRRSYLWAGIVGFAVVWIAIILAFLEVG
jgi:hypothetical protein